MRLFVVVLVSFVSSMSVAQDSTHITQRVGMMTGKTLQSLQECDTSKEITSQVKKISDQIFNDAFPDDSYLPYKNLYKEHYKVGEAEAIAEFKSAKKTGSEKAFCDKVLEDSLEIISTYNLVTKTDK